MYPYSWWKAPQLELTRQLSTSHLFAACATVRNRYPDSMVWMRLLWRLANRVGSAQVSLLAAGVAFYALLAVFPAIAAVLALAGLFTEPGAVVTQLEGVADLVPKEAADILLNQASQVAGATVEGLSATLLLGVAFAIYLATRATTGLIHGLNVAHDQDETRGFFVYWGTVIWLTASLFSGTVLLFVLLVVTPGVLAFLPEEVLSLEWVDTVRALRWFVVAAVFVPGLAMLYRFGPAGGRGRWMSAGLILAAAMWFGGSYGFSLYVANVAHYNASFGSLGGVVILLTWLWLSAYIVFLGAFLDAEVARRTST
ncbi:MAG: YihY/virulence factor BrkB family protein [Silicimonas sp.]|nr:YihY/virulence factor BrkB family protein [Silicimonas sp.]